MTPDFAKNDGLLPVVVQDHATHKVLMLGYMDQAAFQTTLESRKVTFFSRSKQRLWTKGETSGNFLHLVDIKLDCDNDTFLVMAKPEGPTCHTGTDTCFGETNDIDVSFLAHLANIIHGRNINRDAGSYTTSLFEKGINKIAQKVGEEAVELVIEAKDDSEELFTNEAADLIFHFLVLLEAKEIPLSKVLEVLKKRHNPSK